VSAINAGLQLGLHEGLGLDMQPLDLTAALELLLGETAPVRQAVSDWLDKAPAFAAAYGGNASDHPGQLQLAGRARPTAPKRRGPSD
jgi:hypothetical protein